MSKNAVLGTGSWATALSRVLIDNQNEIMMYGIDQEQIDDINFNHQNEHHTLFLTFERLILQHDLYQSMKRPD